MKVGLAFQDGDALPGTDRIESLNKACRFFAIAGSGSQFLKSDVTQNSWSRSSVPLRHKPVIGLGRFILMYGIRLFLMGIQIGWFHLLVVQTQVQYLDIGLNIDAPIEESADGGKAVDKWRSAQQRTAKQGDTRRYRWRLTRTAGHLTCCYLRT